MDDLHARMADATHNLMREAWLISSRKSVITVS